jgi:hypothetical protein
MNEPNAAFDQLWRHVLDHWDDDSVHQAFLRQCQLLGRLPDAAARYRGMTGDPSRRSVAEKHLGALVVVALAALQAERSPMPERRRRLPALLAGMVVGGILLIAYLTAR